MAVTNFIQSVWSAKILNALEAKSVLTKNCLRTYEGDCKFARSVKILGVGEPDIVNYDGTTPLTYPKMSDVGQDLVINQGRAFAFLVDDIDEAQSVPGLKEEYQRKSSHKLYLERDTYVANLIKGVTSNVTTCEELSEAGVKAAIDDAIVELRERHFDEEGVIELSPKAYNLFKNNLTEISTNNPDLISNGKIMGYDGFEVVMSTNMAKDGNYVYCDVRGKKAIAFVAQIEKVEAQRSREFFADEVRGLDVFGAKVIDEARIQVIKIPVKAA